MGISKVILNGVTRMDITEDNPYTGNILSRVQATGGDGEKTQGSVVMPYTLLAWCDFSINTTSSTAASVGTISLGVSAYTSDKIIYVKIRDKAGPRNGYFVGSDTYFYNQYPINGVSTTMSNAIRVIHRKKSNGSYDKSMLGSTEGYGVYAYSLSSEGVLMIYRRYNSTSSLTINGTYRVWVYTLDYVGTAGNPFNYSAI